MSTALLSSTTARPPARPVAGDGASLVQQTRLLETALAKLTDAELRQRFDNLRTASAASRDGLVAEGFALVCQAVERTLGLELYDVQLIAAAALVRGRIAEMATGEGKTLAAAPAAAVWALDDSGVHVMTANDYLADRDFEQLRPVYERLGLSVGLLPDGNNRAVKRTAYDCDVTYGVGTEFGFDYLRDQTTLWQNERRPAGSRFRSLLHGEQVDVRTTMQRGLHCALIDEIDHVLLDDAGTPLILAEAHGKPDEAPYSKAHELASSFTANSEFVLTAHGRIILTDAGRRCAAETAAQAALVLRRPWDEYVSRALRAIHVLRADVDYVVHDGKIKIVDPGTGRIAAERSWSDGLHQAVEVKEGVEVTAENNSTARITRQRFFRLYDNLCGMTGTADDDAKEFRQTYGLGVEPIPLRRPSQRRLLPTRFFADADSKWNAIADDVERQHAAGRPVLIGTRSVSDSLVLKALLDRRGVNCQVLNGVQDADEAAIIAKAGRPGVVTVATNMAGRGTDIRLDQDVIQTGGLHVIVAQPAESARIDRQMIGRSARQGDPGSAQMYASADDALIQLHAPALARLMHANADANGEIKRDLTAELTRAQSKAERQSAATRARLLAHDDTRDAFMEDINAYDV